MSEDSIYYHFEKQFLSIDFDHQIKSCANYELTPLLLRLLPGHQPVLEAGCGSGKWMHFFKKIGIESIGIDWSKLLKERSKVYDPSVQFDTGDLRDLAYSDKSFGSILALGSIEHIIESPRQILNEFYRVLRKGGIGIITVPYFSPVRKIVYPLTAEPIRILKRNAMLRRLVGKCPTNKANKVSHQDMLKNRYRKDIYLKVDFDGYFYEYQFGKIQFRSELEAAGFEIERLFAFEHELGIAASFGKCAGHLNSEKLCVELTILGKVLKRLFSSDLCGHMLCSVIKKPVC